MQSLYTLDKGSNVVTSVLLECCSGCEVLRLCGQVSEAVKIAKGFGSKTTMNYFGLGVEHSRGNGDEVINLRKPLMAIVS